MSNENVVSLFDRKPKKKIEKKIDKEFDFDTIMKRNSDSKDRLSTDRKKANKGVIRSHRLKN